MSEGAITVEKYLTPSDPRGWVAAAAAFLAGVLAFVQSERWEIAALVLVGVGAVVALCLFVLARLRLLESLIAECKRDHQMATEKLASAHTAIAILYERARARGETLPRLTDLLGSDAMDAILRADELRQTSAVQRNGAEPGAAK